jgi:hypothetical protein
MLEKKGLHTFWVFANSATRYSLRALLSDKSSSIVRLDDLPAEWRALLRSLMRGGSAT